MSLKKNNAYIPGTIHCDDRQEKKKEKKKLLFFIEEKKMTISFLFWNPLSYHLNMKVIMGKSLELSWVFLQFFKVFSWSTDLRFLVIYIYFWKSLFFAPKHSESAYIMPLYTQPSNNSSLWKSETSPVLIRKPFSD